MMKRTKRLVLWLAALILLASCGAKNSASNAPASSNGGWDMETGAASDSAAESLPMAPEETGDRQDSQVYQNAGAKLIRRAELTIQTTEFDQAAEALNQLVVDNGGYFENASVYGGSYRNANARRSGEYIVRVPADNYLNFQSSAGELGYVTSSTESSEDVGERYYDAESRLKTQRTKQERLLTLLEKAATMEDIIDLENALSDVEYQIEQLSSQLNRYDAPIGYATFTIYLEEVAKVTEEVGETASLGQKMAAGFAASGEGLVRGFQNFLVWVSYHIFGLAVFAVVVILGVTAGRRQLKKVRGRIDRQDKGE